jgi:hypothetical protein
MEQYFKILAHLSKYGINEDVDITEDFVDYMLNFKHPADAIWGDRIDKIKDFLNVMVDNGHIRYQDITPRVEETEEEREAKKGEITQHVWVKPISILGWLTKDGLDYYYNYELKKATIKSFWNQKAFNMATVCIACASLVASIVITIYTTNQNTILSEKVTKLDSQMQQLKIARHKIPSNSK